MLNKLNKNRGGFTLVEIMIVVAIIALLASVAVPSFLRARKRSQATTIKNDLRLIDAAVDQYAIENNKAAGTLPTGPQIAAYTKSGTALNTKLLAGSASISDLLGNTITIPSVDTLPKAPALTQTALSDVANASFWEPYN